MSHAKHVIVVNGKPRAGKNTAIEFMQRYTIRCGFDVKSYSSIEPVKNMLRTYGIGTDAKTDEDRELLAVVGDAVQKHSQYRTQLSLLKIDEFFSRKHGKCIFFLHMREPENIQIVRRALNATCYKFHTILVRSPREEDHSNAADSGVLGMTYDWQIENDGTLGDLAARCKDALEGLGIINPLLP